MRGRGTLGSLAKKKCQHTSCFCVSNEEHSLDSSGETLVPLGVVVLQANLELDGLDEVALFIAIGFGQKVPNGASHAGH